MGLAPDSSQLLSRLPTHLTTDLFAGARPVKLAADQVLFLADDPGDSCYRVEDGLLKVRWSPAPVPSESSPSSAGAGL
jgi:CRP-like cAMP-binding protein